MLLLHIIFNYLGPTSLFSALGTIPILRQQRDWVGEVENMLIFSTIYADAGVSGWVRKVKKIAKVI